MSELEAFAAATGTRVHPPSGRHECPRPNESVGPQARFAAREVFHEGLAQSTRQLADD
jgi:hypothetical protein